MTDRRTNYVVNLSGNVEARSQGVARSVEQMSSRSNRAFDSMKRKTAEVGKAVHELGQGMQKHAGKVATAATAVAVWQAEQARKQSAELDKQLIRTRLNAGASKAEEEKLRATLHQLNKATGVGFENLQSGFDTLIAGGNDWESSLAMIQAIAPAMAVTSAQGDVLARAMGVAKEQFKFDLSDPKVAVKLLDEMTRGGRLGNAELENLSDIFARVGSNARAAGLDFQQTLGFAEQLSLVEPDPNRLGTLTDSTLRIFTNDKYRKNAAKASGVKFYNADESKRDPLAVLSDLQAQLAKRGTVKRQDAFIAKTFGETDADTIKGLRTLLSAGNMEAMAEKIAEVRAAEGLIAGELPIALDNAADQAARLAAHIREAKDAYVRPINAGFKDAAKYVTGDEMDAPWASTGKAAGIVAGSAVAVGLATYLANKATGGLLTKIGGGILNKVGVPGRGGFAAGGKGGIAGALGAADGVTPVFVTNMAALSAAGALPDMPDSFAKRIGKQFERYGEHRKNTSLKNMFATGGLAAAGTTAVGVGAAGLGGVALGSMIYNANAEKDWMDSVGRGIAQVMAVMGSQEAADALSREEAYKKSQVEVSVKVEAAGGAQAQVTGVKADGAKADVGATQGHY